MPINDAPMNETMGSMSWLRWFSDVAFGIKGDWTLYTTNLKNTGTGTQTVNIQGMGKSADVQIKIESATQGDITLPFKAKETILSVWDIDSHTLVGGAYVSGNLIQLPIVSGNILIKGMVIKWTK